MYCTNFIFLLTYLLTYLLERYIVVTLYYLLYHELTIRLSYNEIITIGLYHTNNSYSDLCQINVYMELDRHKIIINQNLLTESRYCTNSKHISLHSAFIFFKFFSSKYSLDAAAEIPSSLEQISTKQQHDRWLLFDWTTFPVTYIPETHAEKSCTRDFKNVMQVHAIFLYKKLSQQTWLTKILHRRSQLKTADQSNLTILITRTQVSSAE